MSVAVSQDWEDVGKAGVDMTMASAGELLASLYGVAVLVMRALPSGHLTGQLFMRGDAGEACVCVWWRDGRGTAVFV